MGNKAMDRDTLRAIQTPLKEKYLADPEAAVITMKAQGVLGEENITCAVNTPRALVKAGLHRQQAETARQLVLEICYSKHWLLVLGSL